VFGKGYGSLSREGSVFDPEEKFLPAIWRVDAILKRLKHFAPNQRRAVLFEAFDTLNRVKTKGENSLYKANLYIELASDAFRYGDEALAEAVLIAWEGVLEAQLYASLGKAKPGEPGPRDDWGSFRSEARMMASWIRALAGGEASIDEFLAKLQSKPGRGQFALEDFLLAMDYISRKEISPRLPNADSVYERFSDALLNRYGEFSARDQLKIWDILVKTYHHIPASEAALDRLFLNLLKRAGTALDTINQFDPEPALSWQTFRPVAFLLGNPKFPESETYLARRLAHSLRAAQGVDLPTWLLHLDWVFQKLI